MKKLLIVITIIFYAIWRWSSPYPSPLNWDIWEHQTVINAIRGGSFAMFPSQLSDTFRFDGYTTLFHVAIAGIQNIVNTQNILGFWWIAEGTFLILTSLATYALIYELTKNKQTALAGGILSAGFFESSVAFTSLFLLPQTLAALLWVVGMIIVIKQSTKSKKVLTAAVTTLIIFPLHAIVASLGAVFLFIMALKINLNWFLVLIASYAIPTFLATHFGLSGLNGGEAQYFSQTLPEKLHLFRQWYGFLPVPFLLLGLKKTNQNLVLMLATSVGLLASPFPYVLKFMVIIRYIMITIMAIGIGECIHQMRSNIARYISLTMLTVTVGFIFIANTTQWKNSVLFRGIASHVSEDERAATTYLKNHYGNSKEIFLVSDPATQYILEPLTGINTQGGAYMNEKSRLNLLTALGSSNQADFATSLSRIEKTRVLVLAISARTFTWLSASKKDQLSIAYNIWRSDALSLDDSLILNDWKKRFGLVEIYRNPSIVLFEVHYDTK